MENQSRRWHSYSPLLSMAPLEVEVQEMDTLIIRGTKKSHVRAEAIPASRTCSARLPVGEARASLL